MHRGVFVLNTNNQGRSYSQQFVSINLHFTSLNNIIDLFKSYKKFIDKLKNISLRANLSPNNFQNKPTQRQPKKRKRKKKPKPILTTSLTSEEPSNGSPNRIHTCLHVQLVCFVFCFFFFLFFLFFLFNNYLNYLLFF